MEYESNNVMLNIFDNRNPSWWDRRTNLERKAMVSSFLLFLLTIALIITLGIVLLKDYELGLYNYSDVEMMPLRECRSCTEHREPICLEPGCIHAASTVLKYMDTSVNPCEDFYHFACGGFLNETNVPADMNSVDFYSFNFDLLQQQLKTILEQPHQTKDLKPFTLTKRLYNKCMDVHASEVDGIKNIKTILRNMGGWPVLDGYDWHEQQFDWKHTVHKFRRAGFSTNYLISLGLTLDSYNSSRYFLEIDQADLGPEADILSRGLESKEVQAYFSFMVDVATRLGAEMPFALTELKAVLEFEVTLAKISVNKDDVWNTSMLYHPMKISELYRRYPTIAWVEYINGVVDLSDFKVSNEDKIILRVPQYLSDFENLMRWTSKRVQANYLMWRAVKFSIDFLPTHFRDLRNSYYTTVYDITEMPSRWEECVLTVSTRMPFVMGSLYVQKYIKEEDKEVVFEMVANIRNQFIQLLKEIDWMDDSTRFSAFDKIESMAVYTAFSDELLSTKKLQKHYAQLDFGRNNYLSCILNVDFFEKDKYFKKLRQHLNTPDWNVEEYMIEISPNYFPWENKLSIPNAVLQGIFFSSNRPQYLNYGALGYVIGQEIAYGFDATGRQYGSDAHLVNWWSEHTKRAFVRKMQCMNPQSRNYTHNIPEAEIFINGINKFETSIANQGGLKVAYFAYLRWVERYGKEFQLPSLNFYTPPQLFWIAAAQTHCRKYRPEFLKKEGLTEQKSPAFLTVQETFSNVESFGRDFNCVYGSIMNPVHKCYAW